MCKQMAYAEYVETHWNEILGLDSSNATHFQNDALPKPIYNAFIMPCCAEKKKKKSPNAVFSECGLFSMCRVGYIYGDWKNVKEPAETDPETGGYICDNDGVPVCKEIPFTKANAEELLCDPDLIEVSQWLMKQSSDVSNFLIGTRETDLKN